MNKSYQFNAKSILESEARSTTSYESFDVFLSHSSKDAELVLGVKEILSRMGIKVYVDWHDDPQASRENVTVETAELLRTRMKQSKSLIFLATDNALGSKWMPWELVTLMDSAEAQLQFCQSLIMKAQPLKDRNT